MRASLFWLNDEQWAKIKPLIPMNRPGQKPRNNRRVLSGIIHVLKTGCRWQDCPPEYGPDMLTESISKACSYKPG
jgi:transposase